VSHVAGEERCATTALRIDERGDRALRRLCLRLPLALHPLEGYEQVILDHRLRQQVARAGLHRQAHHAHVIRSADDDQRGLTFQMSRRDRFQLLAPQMAEMQDQHVGHLLHIVERVGVPIGVHLAANARASDAQVLLERVERLLLAGDQQYVE
jgi:hypothetical protein